MTSSVENFARGGAYELVVAARLADSSGSVRYIERFVVGELGKTDLDSWIVTPFGQNIFVQAKLSPAAMEVNKELIWISKAKQFAEDQGVTAHVKYVSTVSEGALPAQLSALFQNPPPGVTLSYEHIPLPTP